TCGEIGGLKEQITIISLKQICEGPKNTDPKSCHQLSLAYYKRNELSEAINFAQVACVKGNSEGCGFHRDFISEQNSRRQEALTSQIESQRRTDRAEEIRQKQQQAALQQMEQGSR